MKSAGRSPSLSPKKRLKVVVSESEVVRDAEVQVSPKDPNYRNADEGVVRVRRPGFVTINMEVWEEQQRQKREDRRYRRELDPARTGIWGPVDDED
jgi:hypothetical protein